MPHDDPDPQDPMLLVGVGMPGSLDDMRDMAWALAEEFARLGHPEERVLALFKSPFYAGAHRAWQALGESEVAAIVREACRAWGSTRLATIDAVADHESDCMKLRLRVLGSDREAR